MRPWTSFALIAVVLVKWICGTNGRRLDPGMCASPRNYLICAILREHNVIVNKRFLRFGRQYGEPFLRFGRSETGLMDDEMKRLQDSFDDKAYLRFGRSSPDDDIVPVYNGWYRRKRDAVAEDVNVEENQSRRRRRSTEQVSSEQKRSLAEVENQTDDNNDNDDAKRDARNFPRFGRNSGAAALNDLEDNFRQQFMRKERMNQGWLHFGKRENENS